MRGEKFKKSSSPLSNSAGSVRPWVTPHRIGRKKAMPTIAERAQLLQPALGRLLSVITTLCLRGSSPVSIDLLLAFYLGLMALGVVWLRERLTRVLIPLARWHGLPATHRYGASHA
jgi:hypothetical protein